VIRTPKKPKPAPCLCTHPQHIGKPCTGSEGRCGCPGYTAVECEAARGRAK